MSRLSTSILLSLRYILLKFVCVCVCLFKMEMRTAPPFVKMHVYTPAHKRYRCA